MREYFDVNRFTDVTITCCDRVFKCHRLVLASASQYFDAMFNGSFIESCVNNIVLHDIEVSAFEQILEFMYGGGISIADHNVHDLLRTSSILGLNVVENRCVHYLLERNVPVDDAIEIFKFGYATQKNSLLMLATSAVILEHVDHICRTGAFLQLSVDDLRTILTHRPYLTAK